MVIGRCFGSAEAEELVRHLDHLGQTALFAAAQSGHVGAVQSLVARRAQVDLCDVSNKPAIFFAIKESRPSAALALLDAHLAAVRAKVSSPFPSSLTKGMVKLAAERGLVEVVSRLEVLAGGDDMEPTCPKPKRQRFQLVWDGGPRPGTPQYVAALRNMFGEWSAESLKKALCQDKVVAV